MRNDINQYFLLSEDSNINFSSSEFYNFSINFNSLIQISGNNINSIININYCSFSQIYQNMSSVILSNPVFSFYNTNLQINIANSSFFSNLIGIVISKFIKLFKFLKFQHQICFLFKISQAPLLLLVWIFLIILFMDM